MYKRCEANFCHPLTDTRFAFPLPDPNVLRHDSGTSVATVKSPTLQTTAPAEVRLTNDPLGPLDKHDPSAVSSGT